MQVKCYCCDAIATTVEHVPPQCLFPEQKDLPSGIDLRRNLITVPSCAAHNIEKSGDDQYLMYVLAMNLPAKEVAAHHFFTKIIRSINRRPALVSSFLDTSTDVTLRDGASGEYFETLALQVDFPRLQRALKQVALGLYRYHFGKSWLGSLRVLPEFLRDVDHQDARRLNALQEQLSKVADTNFAGVTLHGDNLPVFGYQTVAPETRADALMRMHFYEGVKVLALFGERSD